VDPQFSLAVHLSHRQQRSSSGADHKPPALPGYLVLYREVRAQTFIDCRHLAIEKLLDTRLQGETSKRDFSKGKFTESLLSQCVTKHKE